VALAQLSLPCRIRASVRARTVHFVGNPGWFTLNDDQHMNWLGDFTGSGRTEVLFWASDGNWWLGSYSGGALNWSFVGNPGWSNLNDDQHMNWIGNFTGSGRTEVLFWASDGNWWLGTYSGGALNWSIVGNPGWHSLNDDQHMNWIGNFTGSGRTEELFWASDGNWWLGTYSGGALTWSMVGNPGW
jgi:hypothetical protein